MTEPDKSVRKGIRRTAILLTLVALAFYFGFIMMGVLKS
tara:strand:+ start:1913 stop:2029 length:117 start_codon:yes stop_codon:yes gene_type:complete